LPPVSVIRRSRDCRRQHRHPIFEPAGAIGDFGEVVAPYSPLFSRKGAMIGRNDLP
jgi:hypothetical protein